MWFAYWSCPYVLGSIHAGNIRVHTGKGKAQKFEPIDWGTGDGQNQGRTRNGQFRDHSRHLQLPRFQFRASDSLYRRAPAGTCATNAPKAASSANKAAAPSSRSGAGGAVGRSKGGNAASGRHPPLPWPRPTPAVQQSAAAATSPARLHPLDLVLVAVVVAAAAVAA
ncbi:hypothetical protein DFJ73DRAFT_766177 [Zopfochytrium polystomum]|nr:hypothetical protein DFJ73DRAFT_766177 [Zopfochytrium polystomum]